MIELRERLLLVAVALLALMIVAGQVRELRRRVEELEGWRRG